MTIDNHFIQKALIVNGFLLVYFCCTNISSFLGIVIGIALFTITKPYGFFSQQIESISNIDIKHMNINSVHKFYNKFLSAPLGKQIVTLLGFYLLTKICWYLPTWLLLVVVGEVYVCWNLLTEYKVFEMAGAYIQLAKQSIQRVFNLVPKYEESK